MKVLGLESSGKIAAVALVEDEEIIAEYVLNAGITHSQTFLPLLNHMLKISNVELKEIDGIAVSQGPGSYTGLRIGIATAKGLALANQTPVIPVSTLKSLAQNIVDFNGPIFAIIFARAQELYYAKYEANQGELKEIDEPQVLLLPNVISKIKEMQAEGKKAAIIGDGYYHFQREFESALDDIQLFIPSRLRHSLSASSVAILGEKQLKINGGIEGSQLVPVYLKKTQAERDQEK